MRRFWKPVFKFVGFVALFLLVVGVILRLTIIEVIVVGHNGMAPTMEAGETIAVMRGSGEGFDTGTIAVCENPQNPGDFVMGRVVGLPGETLASPRGQLTISGRRFDIDWRGERQFTDTINNRTDTMHYGTEDLKEHDHGIFQRGTQAFALREVTVEPGRLYLLGDNRHHTHDDSRNFGTVAAADCMGSVFMRLMPADDQLNDLGHGYLDFLR